MAVFDLMKMRIKIFISIIGIGIVLGLATGVAYRNYLERSANSAIIERDVDGLRALIISRDWLATKCLVDAYLRTDCEAFEVLLISGAKPDGIQFGRLSLVHDAARNADSYWLEMLLEYGADPDYDEVFKDIRPIFQANEANLLRNVELLLDAGADKDATQERYTLLRKAWAQGNGSIVLTLLERGANYNPPGSKARSFISYYQRSHGYKENDLGETENEMFKRARQWFRDRDLDLANAAWKELDDHKGVWQKGDWEVPRFAEGMPDPSR